MEEQQILLFEFKDYEVSENNPDGKTVRDSYPSADDGSTLKGIANAVANHGGSSAITRSRSRSSSSLRVRLSQGDIRLRSKQLEHSEVRSITNSQHTLLASFATAGAATAFLKHSRDVMVQWLEGRMERSITFKHKSSRIVLKGRDDIEELISLLQRS